MAPSSPRRSSKGCKGTNGGGSADEPGPNR
jgi:hypothetical protein